MKERLRGAPGFSAGFVEGALGALGALENLCGEAYQRGLYEVLRSAFGMLGVGALACELNFTVHLLDCAADENRL